MMKTLLLVFYSLLHVINSSTICLLDIELKRPVLQTDQFTFEDFTKKKFPVYSEDVNEIAAQAQQVAKLLEKKNDFSFDSVKAGRSCFILNLSGQGNYKSVKVRLVTLIEETHTTFSIDLVKPEDDKRLMQKRLLDLAFYLEKN